MNNLTITLHGVEYPLAVTLRVAYMLQGQHNHTPYAEILKDLGSMSVEDQIGVVYAAFKCANPTECTEWTREAFQNYYLDNFNLKELMRQLEVLVSGILGRDAPADTDTESSFTTNSTIPTEGN